MLAPGGASPVQHATCRFATLRPLFQFPLALWFRCLRRWDGCVMADSQYGWSHNEVGLDVSVEQPPGRSWLVGQPLDRWTCKSPPSLAATWPVDTPWWSWPLHMVQRRLADLVFAANTWFWRVVGNEPSRSSQLHLLSFFDTLSLRWREPHPPLMREWVRRLVGFVHQRMQTPQLLKIPILVLTLEWIDFVFRVSRQDVVAVAGWRWWRWWFVRFGFWSFSLDLSAGMDGGIDFRQPSFNLFELHAHA